MRAAQDTGLCGLRRFFSGGLPEFCCDKPGLFPDGDCLYEDPMHITTVSWKVEATAGYQPGDPFALIGEYGLRQRTPDLLGSYSMDGDRFTDLSGVAKRPGSLPAAYVIIL